MQYYTTTKSLFLFVCSDSQANSAQLIASLAEKEESCGFGLPSPASAFPSPDSSEFKKLLTFYRTFPEVGMGVALQLMAGYKTPQDFAISARSTINRKTSLSESQVKILQDYVKKDFKEVAKYD